MNRWGLLFLIDVSVPKIQSTCHAVCNLLKADALRGIQMVVLKRVVANPLPLL